MVNRVACFMSLILGLTVISGCGGYSPAPPAKKTTYPVSGQVLIDGQPAPGIGVVCVPKESIVDAEMDKGYDTSHSAGTDADGKFKVSTYGPYDGVPAGEYSLLFVWNDAPAAKKKMADEFNKRYRNSAKSTVKLNVTSAAVDLGKIELTSK